MGLPTSTVSRCSRDDSAAHTGAKAGFFGHPGGLAWLSGAEFCERFSYMGMQALLVLYMTHSLLLPGHVEKVRGFAALRATMEWAYGPLSPQALGSAIFGLYAGLVYLTPLAGGLLADRLLGRTRTVVLGASLMTLGHFLMAFDTSFLIALLCLVTGVGCFKGNIASQLGALYTGEDPRRANAFQVFLLIAQLAGFFAPLICGTLGEIYGWHWGFGAAGVSMVIGLCAYLMGRPMFPPDLKPQSRRSAEPHVPLTRDDWTRITILVALLPVLGLGMVSNQQFFNAYMIWSERTYDLTVGGHSIPVTWLQSLGTVSCTLTIIVSVAFWRWWTATRKEPDEITKIALGTALSAFAPLILALASYVHARTGGPLPLGWAILPQVVNDLGFANVAPIAVALYSRAAPKKLTGLFIGIYYTHLFLANILVGKLGGLLDVLNGVQFWLLHAAVMGLSAVLLFGVRVIAGRRLRDDTPGPERPGALSAEATVPV
jgi:POT family proton-dependent oligopeptide transporter